MNEKRRLPVSESGDNLFQILFDSICDAAHILHGGDMGDLIFVLTAVGHAL